MTAWGPIRLLVAATLAACAPRSPPATVADGPAPGLQRRWALEAEYSLQGPAQEAVEVRLAGEWVTTVSAIRPGEVDLAYEVRSPRLSGAGVAGVTAGRLDEATRRLGRRFWITARKDGAAQEAHFPAGMDAGDRNLLLSIVTASQLVRPEGGAPAWTATERDGSGSYLAAYQQASPRTVVKRKIRYLDLDGRSGAVPAAEVVLSEQRFKLDGAGTVTALEAAERLRVVLGDRGLELRLRLRLSGGQAGTEPGLVGSLARASEGVVRSPIRNATSDPAQVQAQRDRSLLAGHDAAELLAAQPSQAGPITTRRLEALFRLSPEAIPTGVEAARAGRMAAVLPALAAAGTPEALAALDGLLAEPGVPAQPKVDALTGLLHADKPPAAALRVAAARLDDPDPAVRSAAGLVAGALARAGRADHPAEAEAVDQAIAARWSRARSSAERRSLLDAAGNSAGPTLQPMVTASLLDGAPEVREAAVRALRLVPGEEVDRRLAAVAGQDCDAGVRSAALMAATRRHSASTLEVACRSARVDPSAQVRIAAVGVLGERLGDAPAARETLAEVAGQDGSERVRVAARQALDRESPGSR